MKTKERWGFPGKEKKGIFNKNFVCFNHWCGAAQA
jgi:hypothetical protein